MYKTKVLLVIAIIFSIASVSHAFNVIYVDVNGPNDPGTGSYEDPFRRIQDAIDSADSNDTVIIAEGIYTGNGNYDLDPNGKSIIIRSTEPNDPEIVANTIIDPNGAGRGFYFHSGEDANCVIAGLTIRNAYAVTDVPYGGGVYCFYSSPTIRNCIIMNSHAPVFGGGLYCDFSSPRIVNCIITGNSAGYYGGGISGYGSNPEIIGCTITDNTAGLEGGGFEWVLSNPVIINCIITNNKAINGGGISCCSQGKTSLVNCTITRNRATNFGGALYCQDEDSATIENSILWANEASQGPQIYLSDNSSTSVRYCDVQNGQAAVYDPCEGLIWGSGNMDTDPCFASFNPDGDPNVWDLHLQSAYGRWDPNVQSWVNDVNTSDCIDAGDPNSDYASELWPNGKLMNMGAYGGTNQASMNGNPADFDISGAVNFVDFAEFSNKWSIQEFCIEDLTNDGAVDLADLAIFAENWLWQQ